MGKNDDTTTVVAFAGLDLDAQASTRRVGAHLMTIVALGRDDYEPGLDEDLESTGVRLAGRGDPLTRFDLKLAYSLVHAAYLYSNVPEAIPAAKAILDDQSLWAPLRDAPEEV